MSYPKLGFYGGAGSVTGANYLLETEGKRIIVDCGLFQGGRFAEKQNHEPFPYDPSGIDVVLITHAHADHIGRLPKLVHDGFSGTVIATVPTCGLAGVMLEDALKIMKHETEDHGRKPIYNKEDLQKTLALFSPREYNIPFVLPETNIMVTLRNSGHILGACIFEIETQGKKIVFTGDIGNTPAPLLQEPYRLEHADYLIMESVYGDRNHEPHEERKTILERAIEDTVTRGGTVVIPIFALERTQAVLSELNELIEHNRIPRIPVFLDSPLAINATKEYKKHQKYFDEEAQTQLKADDIFSFPGLTLTPTREESRAINGVSAPKIILAGNPHGYGSRIMHHFSRMLPDPKSTLVLVGYSRLSSIGRQLAQHAPEVTIFGKKIPVRATIISISGYSAHADQSQLKNFVSHLQKPVSHIFVTMGEEASSETLSHIIRDEFGIPSSAPRLGDVVELS